MIKKTLQNIEIDDDEFENKKKLFISNNLYTLEDVDAINSNIVNNLIIYGQYETNYDKIIRNVTKKEIEDLIKQLNFDNVSIVVINPLKK